MVISSRLDRAQVIYVTPSHQVPTAVTMATQRRHALLKKAHELDQLIIEDDFEHESNFLGQPHPALRSMDRDNRVIYVSALPKVLAPGLRIGFIVAAADLIREARRLRQLVIGRPSLLNQRTAALFLSLGHYDAFMAKLHQETQPPLAGIARCTEPLPTALHYHAEPGGLGVLGALPGRNRGGDPGTRGGPARHPD